MIYNCFYTIIKYKTKVFRSKVLTGFQGRRSQLTRVQVSPPMIAQHSLAYNLSKDHFTALSSRSLAREELRHQETHGSLVGQAPARLLSSFAAQNPTPVAQENLGQVNVVDQSPNSVGANVGVFPFSNRVQAKKTGQPTGDRTSVGKVRPYRVLNFAFKFCCAPRPTIHERIRVPLCSSSKNLRALASQVRLRRTRGRFDRNLVSFAIAGTKFRISHWRTRTEFGLARAERLLGQELKRPLSLNSALSLNLSRAHLSRANLNLSRANLNLNKVQTKGPVQAKGAKAPFQAKGAKGPVQVQVNSVQGKSVQVNRSIFRSTKFKYQSTIPDFVKIQRKSFVLFLQKGFLDEVLKRHPMTNPKGDLELSFYPEYYKLARPDYSPQKSILKSKTYASKLYIPVQLTNKKNQKINVQWVLLGHLVRFV